MKSLIRGLLHSAGLDVVRKDRLENIPRLLGDGEDLLKEFLKIYDPEASSSSQICQDIFVLLETGFKRDGFFVEFGATNGRDLSNTWLLESRFGWTGILAEPGRNWHAALRANRTATIDTRCVWRETGATIEFLSPGDGEYGTIEMFERSDLHKDRRKDAERYPVETVSLVDLLAAHQAPERIDYLSIDTEGSEFDILENFDFSAYDIRIITCEHNYTPMRQKIYDLLTKAGYQRKFTGLSQWDDWYVHL